LQEWKGKRKASDLIFVSLRGRPNFSTGAETLALLTSNVKVSGEAGLPRA